MEDLMDGIFALLGVLLTAAAGWISVKYNAWSNAQIENVDSQTTREKLSIANQELQHIVWEISQVLVPEVREAAADGKISKEERQKLLEHGWTLFESRFTVQWLEDFMTRMGFSRDRLKDWVVGKIEAFVFEMKLKQGQAPISESVPVPKPPKVGS